MESQTSNLEPQCGGSVEGGSQPVLLLAGSPSGNSWARPHQVWLCPEMLGLAPDKFGCYMEPGWDCWIVLGWGRGHSSIG